MFFYIQTFIAAGLEKCSKTQKDLEQCLISNAEKILKLLRSTSLEEWGLKQLEPIHRPATTIPKGSPELLYFDQKYDYVDFYGFTNASFSRFK